MIDIDVPKLFKELAQFALAHELNPIEVFESVGFSLMMDAQLYDKILEKLTLEYECTKHQYPWNMW
jgi:hypothetical protein